MVQAQLHSETTSSDAKRTLDWFTASWMKTGTPTCTPEGRMQQQIATLLRTKPDFNKKSMPLKLDSGFPPSPLSSKGKKPYYGKIFLSQLSESSELCSGSFFTRLSPKPCTHTLLTFPSVHLLSINCEEGALLGTQGQKVEDIWQYDCGNVADVITPVNTYLLRTCYVPGSKEHLK